MLATMFRNGNKIVFSTEGDGCIFSGILLQVQKQNLAGVKNFDPLASGDQWRSDIAEKFRKFIEFSKQPSKVDWSGADPLFAINKTDITIRIFQALGGYSEMRIVASRPNGNAVYGFGSEMPLEYTMDINGKNITPVANQYIPEPFYGLTASLSEFQRLQSKRSPHGHEIFTGHSRRTRCISLKIYARNSSVKCLIFSPTLIGDAYCKTILTRETF